MSLSLEDKLLGEKAHNYCSSSEDEGDECSAGEDEHEEEPENEGNHNELLPTSPNVSQNLALSCGPQTGPKGVVADYKLFKELENIKRVESEKALLQYAKTHALTSCTLSTELLEKKKDKAVEEALEDLEDDEFLAQYRQNRIKELKRALESLPTYGKISKLMAATFVEEIDNTPPSTTVMVHVYELVNEYFEVLAKEYPHVRFCNIKASDANLSYRFSRFGIPAILVYKGGELIGNLLSITRDLGSEFYSGDLENYLVEHGFLPDKSIGALLNARLNCQT